MYLILSDEIIKVFFIIIINDNHQKMVFSLLIYVSRDKICRKFHDKCRLEIRLMLMW